MFAAANAGHFEVVKVLFDAGASAHACGGDGETLLTFAARQQNVSAVSMLFDLRCLMLRSTKSGKECPLSATLQMLSDFESQTY